MANIFRRANLLSELKTRKEELTRLQESDIVNYLIKKNWEEKQTFSPDEVKKMEEALVWIVYGRITHDTSSKDSHFSKEKIPKSKFDDIEAQLKLIHGDWDPKKVLGIGKSNPGIGVNVKYLINSNYSQHEKNHRENLYRRIAVWVILSGIKKGKLVMDVGKDYMDTIFCTQFRRMINKKKWLKDTKNAAGKMYDKYCNEEYPLLAEQSTVRKRAQEYWRTNIWEKFKENEKSWTNVEFLKDAKFALQCYAERRATIQIKNIFEIRRQGDNEKEDNLDQKLVRVKHDFDHGSLRGGQFASIKVKNLLIEKKALYHPKHEGKDYIEVNDPEDNDKEEEEDGEGWLSDSM